MGRLALQRIGGGLVIFTLVVSVIATQFPFTYRLSHTAIAHKWSQIDLQWFHHTPDGHIQFDRDFAQNLLMLMPLGFGFALWRYVAKLRAVRVVIEAFLFGLVWSFVLETAQLLTPRRFTQLDDLWRNTVGCAIGALVAVVALRVLEERAGASAASR